MYIKAVSLSPDEKNNKSYSIQNIRSFMMHVSMDTNCMGLIIQE